MRCASVCLCRKEEEGGGFGGSWYFQRYKAKGPVNKHAQERESSCLRQLDVIWEWIRALQLHNEPKSLRECTGPFKLRQPHWDNARLHRRPLSTDPPCKVTDNWAKKKISALPHFYLYCQLHKAEGLCTKWGVILFRQTLKKPSTINLLKYILSWTHIKRLMATIISYQHATNRKLIALK